MPYQVNKWSNHCVKCVQIQSPYFGLVRIFLYSDWIRKDTSYLSVFSPNVGKYGTEKLRIWILFSQWKVRNNERDLIIVYEVTNLSLREKCPNTECFLFRIFVYSVRIQENTDQKNSVFGHFSHSVCVIDKATAYYMFQFFHSKFNFTFYNKWDSFFLKFNFVAVELSK